MMHELWFQYDPFALAHSTVGQPKGVETNLFAGLPNA